MINIKYYLGVLASSSLIIGVLFKLMHWPGAGIILSLSILLLILIFFPMAFISSFNGEGKRKAGLYIAAYITLFLNFLAALFKIMHWPGGGVLFFIGFLCPIVIFLPVYLYFHFKEKEESLTNFLYIIFFLVGLSGMSGFLSIDISHQVYKDITRINSTADLAAYYELKSEQVEKSKDGSLTDEILQRSHQLLKSINDLKIDLVMATCDDNQYAIKENTKIISWGITDKYSTDASQGIISEEGKGIYLKQEIDKFHSFLLTIPSIQQSNSLQQITALPELISIGEDKGTQNSWNVLDGRMPLMLTLLKLTEIENCVRLSELEAINLTTPHDLISSID